MNPARRRLRSSRAARLRVLPKLESAPPPTERASAAGLIVVSGPPLSGKRTLGHYVNEYLPRSVHVAQADPAIAELRGETPRDLEQITRELRAELCRGRRVVLSARLASEAARQRVLQLAKRLSVPTLYVHVQGTDPAALERATELASTLTDLRTVLDKLCGLLEERETRVPRTEVPTVTVSAEAPVEDQVQAVLDGWRKLGTAS